MDRRLLWHSLHVEGDPEPIAQLAALVPDAEHPMGARRSMRYTVTRGDTGYEVDEEGDALAVFADADEAADAVHVRAHRRAFELASLAGWVRIHAATVDLDGTRVLVVGPSGSGKTTLAARLLLDGADVQGDESVLVRRDASLAVPRALHLKSGYAQLLPELAELAPALPTVGDVTVLDPVRLGRAWRLRDAPVDHVVLLADPAGEGGEGGQGSVRCSAVDGGTMLEALLTDAFPLAETKARMVSTLAGAIVHARGHRLTPGPPAAMVEALRAAVR